MHRLTRLLVLAVLVLVVAPAAALGAPTWLDPVSLDGAASNSVPDVTAFGDGNAAAAWVDDVTRRNSVQASVRPRGGRWDAPEAVDPGGPPASTAPLIVSRANGELVAVWLTGTDFFSKALRWSRRPAGGTWSAQDLVPAGSCCRRLLDLVPGGDDSVTVLWTDGDGYEARTNTLPPGAQSWQPETVIPSGSSAPALAVAGDGSAVAAWNSFNCVPNVPRCVETAFKPAGGTWSARDSFGPTFRQITAVDVSARPNDEFTVAWAEQPDNSRAAGRGGPLSAGEVYSADRAAGQNAPGPNRVELVSAPLTGPPGCRFGAYGCLDLAARSDGTLALLYQQNDVDSSFIAAALRPPGGTFGEPENAGAGGTSESFPHAAFTRDGTVAAAWTAARASGAVPVAAHRPPGGGWALKDLGADDTSQRLGDVVADAEGNAVTAFRTSFGIRAAGFDGAGPRIEPFTLPPGGRAGQQLPFSAGADDAWSAVAGINWSFGDGGSASGGNVNHAYGFGQRFRVAVTATDAVGNTGSRPGEVLVEPLGDPITPPPGCPGDVDADGICDTVDPTNGATLPLPFKTVNARVISGEVFVKLPAGGKLAGASAAVPKGFTRLHGAATIPVGSTLDTAKGRVELRTAADLRRRTQTSQFFDGRFRIRQERESRSSRSLITELALTGSSFARCGSARKASASARSERRIRRLWGDGKGSFRTKGRHAAATVRGTRWLVEDRCDGTLVKVSRGRVEVRDKIRLRTVQVRAGRRYLARLR